MIPWAIELYFLRGRIYVSRVQGYTYTSIRVKSTALSSKRIKHVSIEFNKHTYLSTVIGKNKNILCFRKYYFVDKRNQIILSSASLTCQTIKSHRCNHKPLNFFLSYASLKVEFFFFYIFSTSWTTTSTHLVLDFLNGRFLFILFVKTSFVTCSSVLQTCPNRSRRLLFICDIMLYYLACYVFPEVIDFFLFSYIIIN